MACCAFAIFLLGQLYGLVDIGRRWLRLSGDAEALANAPVSWRPGMQLPARPASRWRPRRLAYATSLVALAVFIGAISHESARANDVRALLRDPVNWCGEMFSRQPEPMATKID